MGKIQIRKRISLEFIGDEYKDSYFIFNSIPLKEYETISDDLDKIKADNKKAVPFILKMLQEHFVEGKFEGEDVSSADLADVDVPTCIEIFTRLTGQADPKQEGQLPTS